MKLHRIILLMCMAALCMVVVVCVHVSAKEKSHIASEMSDDVLLPVNVDGKWGFINTAGDIEIEFLFDSADDFSENLAGVEINGKYGYIDTNGNIVIPLIYQGVGKFRNGIAVVKSHDSLGIIDKQGIFLLAPDYQVIENINIFQISPKSNEGFFIQALSFDKNTQLRIHKMHRCNAEHQNESEYHKCTVLSAEWGLIDFRNDIYIKPAYNAILEFSEGIAGVGVGQTCSVDEEDNSGNVSSVGFTDGEWVEDCKWGFIDVNGDSIIAPRFEAVDSFNEGLAAVRADRWWYFSGGYWGFIDKMGDYVVTPRFVFASSFDNGFAVVNNMNIFDSKPDFRTIQNDGRFYQIPGYDYSEHFVGKYFIAFLDEKVGITNSSGEVIVPFSDYDFFQAFDDNHFLSLKSGRKGLVNKAGKTIVPPVYYDIRPFTDGLAIIDDTQCNTISCDIRIGFIDEDGNIAVDLIYEKATGFSDGHAVVWKDGKTMVIDKVGKVIGTMDYIVEPYEREKGHHYTYKDYPPAPLIPFKDGLMIFKRDMDSWPYKLGVLNSDGKVLFETEYDDIKILEKGIIKLYKEEHFCYADKSGHIFWPLQH